MLNTELKLWREIFFQNYMEETVKSYGLFILKGTKKINYSF